MDFKQFGERNKVHNAKLNEHVRSIDTDLCKDGNLPEDPQRKSEVVEVGSKAGFWGWNWRYSYKQEDMMFDMSILSNLVASGKFTPKWCFYPRDWTIVRLI